MANENQETRDLEAIWLWRGYAVGAYSGLEQSLCALFQALIETSNNKAAIIFFKITSTRARNDIIEELVKDKFGTEYNLFWNSYLKILRQVDGKRNEIVHWAALFQVRQEKPALTKLVPPNFWSQKQGYKPILMADLREFVSKCDVMGSLASRFENYICEPSSDINPAKLSAWQRIFHEPIAYPLQANHLLYTSWQEP